MRFWLVSLLLLASVADAQTAAQTDAVGQARALLASGKTEQALEALHSALRASPADSAIHNMLGAIYNRSGKYPEALRHAQEAARLKPDEPRYRYNRGIVLAEHGRFDEALGDFDYAIDKIPGDAAMHLERGAALLSLGRSEQARADWGAARRLNPALVWTDWYEGLHDLLDLRLDKAAEALARVARREPQFENAHAWLALAHGLAGRSYAAPDVQDPWVRAIVDFHAGRITHERLLGIAAEDSASGDPRRAGEAWLHLGVRLKAASDPEANAAFARAAATAAPRHMWKLLAERLAAPAH